MKWLGDQSNSVINGKPSAAFPPLGIGSNTHIRKSIVDKNARIGKDVMVSSYDSNISLDKKTLYIKDGTSYLFDRIAVAH